MVRQFLRAAALLLCGAAGTRAQQSDSTRRDSVRVFDPIVVTATRRDERRSNAILSTLVVSRDDIRESGATNVAGVLTQQLGLQLGGGSPVGSQMLIQGLGDQRVLVLLDGQPLTGRVGGVLDLSRLPASIVERIEVVKGPQSVFYGTDAMGGVINIVSRRPGARNGLLPEGAIVAGSHGRLDLSGRLAGSLGDDATFGLDASRDHVDLAPGLASDAGAFAEHWSAAPRLGWKASPTLHIDAGGLGVLERQRYRSGQLFNFSDNTQIAAHVAGAWTHGTSRWSPTLSFSSFDHLSRAATAARPASDSGARDAQRLMTAGLNYSGIARGFVVDAGGELRHESIVADRVPGRQSLDGAAVFGQTTWMSEHVSIAPGARASWSEQWGTSVAPRLALMVRPAGQDGKLTARASIGAGFRAPDFKELHLRFVNASAGYAVDGNPRLRPEHSTNVTLGLEWIGRTADVRANAFHNRIRDLIETAGPDATGTYTYENVGRASTEGLELEGELHIGIASLGGGYSYLRARDLTLGLPILGRASHTARAAARASVWHDVRVSVTGLYSGTAPATLNDMGQIATSRKAFTQINARIARRFAWDTELFVGADDAFDAKADFAWPGFTGRQLSAGASWPSR